MWRMHLFTSIQIICLVIIYIVKQYKASTLAFPFVLVIIAIFRRVLVPRMFSEPELNAVRAKQVHVPFIETALQLDGHDPENEQESIYGMHASFSQYAPPKRKTAITDAPPM